jgi:hypothetical protein
LLSAAINPDSRFLQIQHLCPLRTVVIHKVQ